jgi:hypothetical protein
LAAEPGGSIIARRRTYGLISIALINPFLIV